MLTEKLARWKQLRKELDELEQEIRQEVMQLKKTIEFDGVVATYSSGRGSYDYVRIAQEAQIPEHVLRLYSKTTTDFRKACESYLTQSYLQMMKQKYYIPGDEYVNIKFKS
jgi:hypothetical protein